MGMDDYVVQDDGPCQKLSDEIAELEALRGIRRGLADVEAGRVTPLEEFEAAFRAKHGMSRRIR